MIKRVSVTLDTAYGDYFLVGASSAEKAEAVLLPLLEKLRDTGIVIEERLDEASSVHLSVRLTVRQAIEFGIEPELIAQDLAKAGYGDAESIQKQIMSENRARNRTGRQKSRALIALQEELPLAERLRRIAARAEDLPEEMSQMLVSFIEQAESRLDTPRPAVQRRPSLEEVAAAADAARHPRKHATAQSGVRSERWLEKNLGQQRLPLGI